MDINLLYKSIAEAVGLKADENGLLFMDIDGQHLPCELSGKRLALPTPAVLKDADWEHVVAFHPLSENVLRGESPVLKKLRVLMNLRVTYVMSKLLERLLDIAADHDYHKKLSPTAAEFLTRVPNADEKTVKALDKILDSLELTGDRRLVSIYLKRGGQLGGDKFSRVAVTSFPILDQFETDDHEIFGVKMRGKDKETIANLFNYLIPNGNNLELYSAGSNSATAPYFHCLVQAYVKLAKRLNAVVRVFKKHLEHADELTIGTDWETLIEDLSIYRDLIPSLSGNEGEVVTGADAAVVTEEPKSGLSRLAQQASVASSGTIGISSPAPAAPAPVASQPAAPVSAPVATVGATAPAPAQSSGRSWDEIRRSNPALGGMAPVMPAFGGNPAFGAFAQPVAARPGQYAGYDRGIPQNTGFGAFPTTPQFGQVQQPGFGAPVYQGGL